MHKLLELLLVVMILLKLLNLLCLNLPVMPDTRYVMEGEIAEDLLACKDSYDLEKLLRKWKEKSLNARVKYDHKFSTSPNFVTDKDYEVLRNSVNPVRLKNNPVALSVEDIDVIYHDVLGDGHK